ncbi:ArnT family glycosyltransferase [Undibacterium arcticum]|uniref:ArnT family glycosyltransferase n=1 Tax=Undibacterium arcticum TaxID=1762892 RepID=A0ABV7EZC2_9BURK
MKPVRLPASATLTLPRWGLFLLCLLYILPGLFGRDPWKNDDAAGFGIMWTMAHGSLQDWLWPNIVGLTMPEEGPLAYWLGALCIKLFGGLLGDAMAARLASIGFFLLGATSVWYSTYLLGRRPVAQPLKLAFGGQPEPQDFGRTLADGALLIYLGCLGLLLHSHESTAEALNTSLIAFLLYAAARYIEAPQLRRAGIIGIALAGLVLTRGWALPLGLWLSLFIAFKWLALDGRRSARDLGGALVVALALPAAWLSAAYAAWPYNDHSFDQWLQWNVGQLGLPTLHSLSYFLRYAIWFFWPAWPFAAWAVYAWRRQRKALHIVLPLAFVAILTLLALINPGLQESILLPLLPPLAMLAAFGLPTMKRSAINSVDWFSVMTLTTCAAFIWLGWLAKQTGWPIWLAKNALKLAPGFKPEFNLLALLIAAAASAGWIALVNWRISRHPSVLWRAVVLSSGGVILCWLLLMTLWMPWINYGKSYAGVAQQIAQQLPPVKRCVDTNVGPAQRASFAYLGNIPFKGYEDGSCDFLLLQDSVTNKSDTAIPKKFRDRQWQLLWEGRRPSDRDERFRLYKHLE